MRMPMVSLTLREVERGVYARGGSRALVFFVFIFNTFLEGHVIIVIKESIPNSLVFEIGELRSKNQC